MKIFNRLPQGGGTLWFGIKELTEWKTQQIHAMTTERAHGIYMAMRFHTTRNSFVEFMIEDKELLACSHMLNVFGKQIIVATGEKELQTAIQLCNYFKIESNVS